MSGHDQITTHPRRGRRLAGTGRLRSPDDGSGAGSATTGQDKAFEGALKFSKCMRDHGIDFPDPQRVGNGGIKLTMKGGTGADSAKLRAAEKDCQKYMRWAAAGLRARPSRPRSRTPCSITPGACAPTASTCPTRSSRAPAGARPSSSAAPARRVGPRARIPSRRPSSRPTGSARDGKLADLEKGGPGGGPSVQSSGSGER